MEIIDNSNYKQLGELETGSLFEIDGAIYLLTDNYEDKFGGGDKWECISLSHTCGSSYYFDDKTLVVPRTGKLILV